MRALGIILLLCLLPTVCVGKTYHFIGSSFPEILEQAQDGEIRGLGADIVYKIAKSLNVDIKITLYPWKRAHLIMKRGGADAIIGPYKSEERLKYLEYSNFHFYEDEILLYGLTDSTLIWDGDLSKLTGLKIGVIRGWSLGQDFNLMKDSFKIIYLNNIEQLFSMLKLRRIDIAISHPRASLRLLSLKENKKIIKPFRPSLTINRGYFGFSKKRDLSEFKKKFDIEYEKSRRSGSL